MCVEAFSPPARVDPKCAFHWRLDWWRADGSKSMSNWNDHHSAEGPLAAQSWRLSLGSNNPKDKAVIWVDFSKSWGLRVWKCFFTIIFCLDPELVVRIRQKHPDTYVGLFYTLQNEWTLTFLRGILLILSHTQSVTRASGSMSFSVSQQRTNFTSLFRVVLLWYIHLFIIHIMHVNVWNIIRLQPVGLLLSK